MRYSILEINTAVKPYIILDLINRGLEHVLYIDPDIYVFRSLDEVLVAFETGYDLVLTPHITRPLKDEKHPTDHEIMCSGIWNLGFGAFRRSDDVYALLEWWRDKCATQCLVDISANIFTDQRWMDMAPAFVEKTRLLHHPGYNVAYWNLSQRKISRAGEDQWIVNGQFPLCFFHFSGVNPSNENIISKHQDRFSCSDLPELTDLFGSYRARIRSNGWEMTRSVPYGWQESPSGRKIPDLARTLYRQLYPSSLADKFENVDEALNWFCEWYDQSAHDVQPDVTRLMMSIHHRRPDLQRAFNLSQSTDVQRFHDWFQSAAERECKVDKHSLLAAINLIRKDSPGRAK